MDGCSVSSRARGEMLTHADDLCSGDLTDDKVKKEYERGYQILLDFYHKHL